MSKKIKKIIQFVIFLSLGIVITWLSVKDLGAKEIQDIKESVAQIGDGYGWLFLLLSMLSLLASHVARALRSIILLEPLNYKIRKSISFYSVMVCYLGNLAFPRLGEVLRCTFLQRYEKVPFQQALGSVVTERAIDLIIFVLMFFAGILLNTNALAEIKLADGVSLGESLATFGNNLLHNQAIYWLLGGFILFVILVFLTRKWWRKISFFVKIKNFLLGIWQGLVAIKDLKQPILFIIYTILIWLGFFLCAYTCFFAFDFLADLGMLPAFTVMAFGTIGYLVSQGGLGAAPLFIAATLGLYGVTYEQGLAAGWINWTSQTVIILIFGFLSLILASLSKTKTEISEVAEK